MINKQLEVCNRRICERLTIDSASTTLVTFGPFTLGEYIAAIHLVASTYSATATALASPVELYACNKKPSTVAEARNGRAITHPIDTSGDGAIVPWEAHMGTTVDTVFAHRLNFVMPVAFVANEHELYLALVFNQTNQQLSNAGLGSAWLIPGHSNYFDIAE